MTPLFVVAQPSHSGSAYTAALFTAAGIPTGHEAFYGPHGLKRVPRRHLIGDSSWPAAGYLDNYPGVVYHQLRHPLRVVRSLAPNALATGQPGSPFTALRRRILGDPTGHPMTDLLKFLVVVHELIASRAVRTWQVEQLDAAIIRAVADDHGLDPGDISAALAAIPTDVNHHRPVPLDWAALPAGLWRDRLVQQTIDAGYPMEATP